MALTAGLCCHQILSGIEDWPALSSQAVNWDIVGLYSFAFHFLEITVLHGLMFNQLKLVSYISSGFLGISGRSSVPLTPLWPEAEVL